MSRHSITRRVFIAASAASAVGRMDLAEAADSFPSHPLTWIVPYPTGGFGDAVSRMLTQKMSESMKQSVVVDNRPGAGGQIGASFVKQQPADGYSLLYGDIGLFAMNSALYAHLNYDMGRDFLPLTRLFSSPLVVVVPANGRYDSFADLAKAAHSEKGLSYGSYGVGSQPHVWTEMLKRQWRGNLTHVPYKGAAPALQDLMGDRLDMMADVSASSIPFIKDGKVRALAVVGSQGRLQQLPDVPTLTELGYPGIDFPGWNGVVVRKGTPPDVVARLHKEIVAALTSPEVTARYSALGLSAAPLSPPQFAAFLETEQARWGATIKDAGITLE